MSDPNAFIIPDVHGNIAALSGLMDKASPTSDDVIIQLGDLGNFVRDSHVGDLACYEYARKHNFNVLLGNHDAPALHLGPAFGGYDPPYPELLEVMREVNPGMFITLHGYLLTHAGLAWEYRDSDWEKNLEILPISHPIFTGIGYARGGYDPVGGILWRDASEPLADIPQIFGHTPHDAPTQYGKSWCLDVGCKTGMRLCGMWLPSMEIIHL